MTNAGRVARVRRLWKAYRDQMAIANDPDENPVDRIRARTAAANRRTQIDRYLLELEIILSQQELPL